MQKKFLTINQVVQYTDEALNQNAEPISGRLEGVPAIVFQHELLHLLGLTYLDVAQDFTRFDHLTVSDRQPQQIEPGEEVPLLLNTLK